MDIETAKYLLSAINPDLEPEMSPELRAAFELMKDNEELSNWYRKEREFDQMFASQLRQVEVPLLRLPEPGERTAGLDAARRRWLWMATCLVPVLLLGLFLLNGGENASYDGPKQAIAPGQPAELEDFRTYVSTVVANGIRLDTHIEAPEKAIQWLKDQEAPHGEIPAVLVALESMGCTVYKWRGQKVSLICFKDKRHPIHLFMMENDLVNAVAVNELLEAQVHGRTSKAWMYGGVALVLVPHQRGQLLPEFSI